MAHIPQTEIETHLASVDRLVSAGRQLRAALGADPSDAPALARLRGWQQECAATINQLSGGSKAHWLSRAYSAAFLVEGGPDRLRQGDSGPPKLHAKAEGPPLRAAAEPRAGQPGGASEPPVAQIVSRVIAVLEQARTSLTSLADSGPAARQGDASQKPPLRDLRGLHGFEFVRDPTLRTQLQQADAESQQAFARGDFGAALVTSASILDAIITEALERTALAGLAGAGAPPGTIAGWPFETRIAVAEKAGLIRGGCARLPQIARDYRSMLDESGELRAEASVSELEAKLTAQVVNVIRRDLAPGR